MSATLNNEWAVTAPEEVGMDAARLSELDKFLEQWPKHKIHAVIIARRGKLVLERYFSGEDVRWHTQQCVHGMLLDAQTLTQNVLQPEQAQR
jgi:hypothetical protein